MGRISRASLVLLASFVLSSCNPKESWPKRPISLLCPWAIGGGTDRVSRQIGAFLEKELDVPVNIFNATGGAGVSGHSRGARARPDGYTLTMMTVEINMLRWRKLTKISWEDFTPVMLLNRDAAALFVRADSPWRDLAALTEEIRRRPGELTASGTATGGIWHLALAGWLEAAGLTPADVKWIPHNGAAPSLSDLQSGSLAMVSCSLPEARAQLGSGKLRCLGVMADQRVGAYKDVPTFKEQGVDWVMGGWRGLGLPKNVPEEVVDRLLVALRKIVTGATTLGGTSFPEYMAREGFDATWELPSQFRETLRRTDAELGALLTSEAFAGLSDNVFEPYDFPILLSLVMGVLLLALGLKHVPVDLRAGAIHFVEVVFAVVLYVRFTEELGFLVTAGGILFFLLWRLGTRLWISATLTVFFVPAVYALFTYGLRVPLPRGIVDW